MFIYRAGTTATATGGGAYILAIEMYRYQYQIRGRIYWSIIFAGLYIILSSYYFFKSSHALISFFLTKKKPWIRYTYCLCLSLKPGFAYYVIHDLFDLLRIYFILWKIDIRRSDTNVLFGESKKKCDIFRVNKQ